MSPTELGCFFKNLYDEHQRWSDETFGTVAERGPTGPLKHLAKEVGECLQNPDDRSEYADCMLLLLDASRRAGISLVELLQSVYEKLEINRTRKWQKVSGDEAVEHVRDSDTQK